MYIVTVFPIARNAFKERLSYWSAHSFRSGSIITVPVRGRNIAALVETVQSAQQAKTAVKNANFMTKKIEQADERMLVRPGCVRAAIKTSAFFISPFGQVLRSLIPESILSAPLDVVKEISENEKNESRKSVKSVDDEGNDIVPEILTFQTNDADRYSSYKSIVREEFARKRSVLMIVPTVVVADDLSQILRKGIDDYVVVLHSGVSKKKQRTEWVRAVTEEHPILIIATQNFMSVPRRDVHTIILEKESSRAYLSTRPPYIDARTHAEYYAREIGARLIYGDSLLRIETLHRRESGEVGDLFSPSFRIENGPQTLIVNMSDVIHKATKENKHSPIMSEELISMIQYAIDKKSRMFIYCARKGLAPQTVCGDCSQTVLCDQCQAPVVLHQSKSEDERFFLCHHCGKKRSAAERCKKCQSWKLITLGIGMDTVFQEISKLFPKGNIFKIDRDTVSTDKQARIIIGEFEKTPGAILVGTETALAFLPQVPYTAIASLDSLFSLPDFRLNERICHTLLRLISSTSEYFLIQTRNPSAQILEQVTRGALTDFYRKEIEMRQMLQYPPFSTFIKVTAEGRKADIASKMERLQQMLEPWPTSVFPAFIPTIKGNSVLHMLITVPPESWPDEGLTATLSSLQPDFVVKVNPESLL